MFDHFYNFQHNFLKNVLYKVFYNAFILYCRSKHVCYDIYTLLYKVFYKPVQAQIQETWPLRTDKIATVGKGHSFFARHRPLKMGTSTGGIFSSDLWEWDFFVKEIKAFIAYLEDNYKISA